MGSQKVCNPIYSVSRTCRLVYRHPASPLNLSRLGHNPLPLLRFTDSCPVYFDCHTLSVKQGQLSRYTPGGRIRFHLSLQAQHEASFHERKLREIVLLRTASDGFELSFFFSTPREGPETFPTQEPTGEIPQYVTIDQTL